MKGYCSIFLDEMSIMKSKFGSDVTAKFTGLKSIF